MPIPPSALREIDLVADKEELDEIQNGWTERIVRGEGPRGVQMTSERFGLYIDAQMNHAVGGPQRERDLRTGQVNGSHQGTTRHFNFMLERVGFPELVTILPAIWLVFFLGRGVYQQW